MPTNNAWNSQDPAQVAKGGTGSASFTTYGPVVAAATSTGALTSIAPSATSGVPFVSGGSSANPSFTTAVVAGGGTGVTSNTAYAVLCGGTTSTGAIQSIASVGTSGQLLTSNGASALPTFQTASAVGGSLVLIQTRTASSVSTLTFTTGITSTYTNYIFLWSNVTVSNAAAALQLQLSTNGGSSYINSGYSNGFAYVTTGGAAGYVAATTVFNLADSLATTTVYSSGSAYFHELASGGSIRMTGEAFRYDGTTLISMMFSALSTTTSANALQVLTSAGTFSGNFSLYGVAK